MTKHIDTCRMAFGRKDPNCTRCQELIKGASPRAGWQKSYYERKRQEEESFERELKSHNCETSNCGTVCTAFQW